MSAFTEVDHHVLSGMIPFTVRLVRVSSVPFLFWSRPEKTKNVCARIFLHILQRFWNSQCAILCFLLLSILCHCTLTWRWFVLSISQVHTVFQSSFSGSRRESVMWWILGIFSTRTPSAPRRFDPILDIGMSSWTIRFSPSMSVWCLDSSCPCTVLNRRIHWFLL